jgi:hypothetical protein
VDFLANSGYIKQKKRKKVENLLDFLDIKINNSNPRKGNWKTRQGGEDNYRTASEVPVFKYKWSLLKGAVKFKCNLLYSRRP